MQKIITILIGASLSVSVFAQMTFGSLLESYFSILLPLDQDQYADVELLYTDIDTQSDVGNALKKAVYHGLFPNASIALDPSREANFHDAETLLGYHFWRVITPNYKRISEKEFGEMMLPVSKSYAFSLVQEQNLWLGEHTDASDVGLSSVDGFEIVDAVYSELKKNHYDTSDISDQDIIYGAAAGIAQSYDDPYTTFLKPSEKEEFDSEISGDYVGIGAYVHVNSSGEFIVTGTIDGSSAQMAGLLSDDRIVHVDDFEIPAYSNVSDIVDRIKGPEGSSVTLGIQRWDRYFTETLVRSAISVPFVSDRVLESGEYYIDILLMGDESAIEFVRALKRLKETGIKKVILDLRWNPGGILREVRVMLDALVPTPERVITISTRGSQEFLYSFYEPIIDMSEYQMVILIDKNSASASEILAASVHEFFPDNITLVGEQTYGKWSAQQVVYLDDGSAIKYTFAHWKTGQERKGIDGRWVQPEYVVQNTGDEDLQLQAAKHILRFSQ